MNKYLKRGLLLIVPGIGFNILGYAIKQNEWGPYGWAMILGTILFGAGFLFVFYSLVRKVEYKGLVEERAAEAEKKEQRKAERKALRRNRERKLQVNNMT
ncbi:hypothetical protein BDE36_4658 [Arcticibacter tournemirensis]|uniref:Signal peptidase n=1 Tax=Arcticibacter tournemirensis TaxID=699437 RepID=A0A5M9HH45_9SPHI|nr:signal peptidase [Arcticibacter tournemirensis]KAA8485849.1 signal peptidase [Arcticibacter tournemirensis]TQM46902.1 hypothetical protein BDE36_4658 [Arcticibacter tournemirensis]